jgi:hypothetical protein
VQYASVQFSTDPIRAITPACMHIRSIVTALAPRILASRYSCAPAVENQYPAPRSDCTSNRVLAGSAKDARGPVVGKRQGGQCGTRHQMHGSCIRIIVAVDLVV